MRCFVLLAALAAACATTPPLPEYPYVIDFEVGHAEGDGIVIEEVRGTRPRIEIGGEYLVRGRYELTEADAGTVFLFQTAFNWDNSGPVMDHQRRPVTRGSGTFVLRHDVPGDGALHVVLQTDDGRQVADVYFGQGEFQLRKKTW